MNWTPEAEEKLELILEDVPGPFRGMARDAARRAAEEIAEEEGKETIELEGALRGLIKASPFHMRKRLKETMVAKGINVEGL